jgi:hypothetical protein
VRGVSREVAWDRWQAAAGPWRGWAVCHALAAPDVDSVRPQRAPTPPAAERLANELAEQLSHADASAVLLDLNPLVGVPVASSLNRSGLAHAVLVLPRWPYAEAVLSVDALLSSLMTESDYLSKRDGVASVVFVLDAERGTSIVRPTRDRRADNRYRISAADLPNLARLRAAGIRRVVKISHA